VHSANATVASVTDTHHSDKPARNTQVSQHSVHWSQSTQICIIQTPSYTTWAGSSQTFKPSIREMRHVACKMQSCLVQLLLPAHLTHMPGQQQPCACMRPCATSSQPPGKLCCSSGSCSAHTSCRQQPPHSLHPGSHSPGCCTSQAVSPLLPEPCTAPQQRNTAAQPAPILQECC
jgi:hypothetical protein